MHSTFFVISFHLLVFLYIIFFMHLIRSRWHLFLKRPCIHCQYSSSFVYSSECLRLRFSPEFMPFDFAFTFNLVFHSYFLIRVTLSIFFSPVFAARPCFDLHRSFSRNNFHMYVSLRHFSLLNWAHLHISFLLFLHRLLNRLQRIQQHRNGVRKGENSCCTVGSIAAEGWSGQIEERKREGKGRRRKWKVKLWLQGRGREKGEECRKVGE